MSDKPASTSATDGPSNAHLFPGKPSEVMNIRTLNSQLTTLSVPFLRFDKIKFGGRATLITLQSGNLAVFSPVALTAEVHETIKTLSPSSQVSYIIAPDIEHHIYLGAWKSAFPKAHVIGPEGLREKRAKQGNEDVQFDFTFTKENKRNLKLPEEFEREFEVEYWDSHANKEIVLLHKPTKTMIEADLVFNLPAREQFSKQPEVDPAGGFLTKIAMYFASIKEGSKGQNRFNWYIACKDKVSFAESAKRCAQWDFETIIPCHGDVIEKNGNDVFRRLFAWHL